MKRGGPLRRRKPLRARKPLARGRIYKGRPVWRSRDVNDKWQKLRGQVFIRDWGRCVVCGVTLNPNAWECHHRQFKSRGGKDVPQNLIACCLMCHVPVIHEGDAALASAMGWAVSAYSDPRTIPVRYPDGRWWLLTADGCLKPYEKAEAC